MYELNQSAPRSEAEKAVVGASHHTVPKMAIRRLTQAWPFRAKSADAVRQTAEHLDQSGGNNSSFVT